ncbi:MAG: DUF1559 domain-containing protein [Gemmataceae bacterium]
MFLIRLDGNRLRADEVPDPKVPPGEQVYARGRKIICRNCPDLGKDTAYVMLTTAVHIAPHGAHQTGGGSFSWLLDPRTIGLTTGGVFDTTGRPIDRCLDDPDWVDRRAEPDPTGRPGVWVLHGRHKVSGQTRRTWVDTTRGPSVIREETAGIVPNTGGVRYDGLMECDLAQDPVSGRLQCANNLRQLALAAHQKHGDAGRLPPGVWPDRPGERYGWLSWRALLLPYLDQDNLWRQVAAEMGRANGSAFAAAQPARGIVVPVLAGRRTRGRGPRGGSRTWSSSAPGRRSPCRRTSGTGAPGTANGTGCCTRTPGPGWST